RREVVSFLLARPLDPTSSEQWKSLLADIIDRHGDPVLRDLAERIRHPSLMILPLPPDQFTEVARARYGDEKSEGIQATYLTAEEKGGPPTILFVDDPPADRSRKAVYRWEQAVLALHEAVHLFLQSERHGNDWPHRNVLPAEMEARAIDLLFRLL